MNLSYDNETFISTDHFKNGVERREIYFIIIMKPQPSNAWDSGQ